MDINFQSHLNIQNIGALKTELATAIDKNDGIVLDASEVEVVDTASLQLLVAFIQHAALKKCEPEWRKPSDAFLKVVDLMGLKDCLHV